MCEQLADGTPRIWPWRLATGLRLGPCALGLAARGVFSSQLGISRRGGDRAEISESSKYFFDDFISRGDRAEIARRSHSSEYFFDDFFFLRSCESDSSEYLDFFEDCSKKARKEG